MSLQSHLSALRENPDTARAGMKWTDSENTELMERAVQGMNIDDIAKAHMRTVTGVKARIMANALAMMESHDMTLEEVSMHVHIPLKELEAYKQKDEKPKKSGIQNMRKNKKATQKDETKTDVLTILKEIRDLLKVIVDR